MTADPSPDRPTEELAELEELYRREVKRVIALLLWLGATWELAEDATQEAFLQAQRCWTKIRCYDQPGAWIRMVAVQRFRNAYKRGLREIPWASDPEELGEEPGLELTAEVAEVWQAVRALPRRQQEVTVLRFQGGLSINEIAEAPNVLPGTVKTHLHHARVQLAKRLGEDEGGMR
ncbi:MAG TPA: RNA polymerase sigma factor [Actinomycetes bacterium]|nr:RNA polymerase sigma factor [Actinomycetes bacterium]